MYIIVVGGGSVGYHLSKALLNEGHEVLVLEKNTARCDHFEDELGSICLRGDGCEVATLAEAGTSRADLFIATTNEDEDNLVSCQIAKHKFEVPRTIARINNPHNERLFKQLGIDCTISVTNLILQHIKEEIPSHPLVHLLTTAEGNTDVVEIKIPQNSKAVGKSIKELQLPPDSVLTLLIREGHKPLIPANDTTLQANDRIIVLTSKDNEEDLRKKLTDS